MAVEIDRSAGHLRLRTHALRVELALATLELTLGVRDGEAPHLSGARPRALIRESTHLASGSISLDVEDEASALGPVTRVLACCDAGADLQLGLSIDTAADWSGVVLQLAVQNGGGRPVDLAELDALFWSDARGELELPGPATAWVASVLPERGEQPGLRRRLGDAPRTAGSVGPGPALELRAPGHAGLSLGFLGALEHAGRIELGHRGAAVRWLRAGRSLGATRLEPGGRLAGERLWLGIDGPADDGLAGWAARCARELGRAAPRPLGVWQVPAGGSPAPLAAALRERDLDLDVLLGERPLDPREPGAADALAGLAAAAHDAALAPAVRTGRIEPAGEHDAATLERAGVALREHGVRHVWIDDIGPAGPVQLEEALRGLRAGLGEGARIAARGGPLLGLLGQLDALSLQLDAAPPPAPGRLRRWLGRASGDEREPLAVACLAGRVLCVDTGPLDLGALDEAALGARLALSALLGGDVVLRGDPSALGPARLELARRALPPRGAPPWRPGGRAALAARLDDGAVLLRTHESLPLGALALAPAANVFDVLGGRCTGTRESMLGPHPDAPLLRLTPARSGPRVVGSTLHLSGGSAEVSRLELRGDALHLSLRLPGPRQGVVSLMHAAATDGSPLPPLHARVAFRDALELIALYDAPSGE